jgi:hypothetical protein
MASGVEFEEPGSGFRGRATVSSGGIPDFGGAPPPPGYTDPRMANVPKMAQWLMKKGLARSPHVAQAILIAVIIINIIITFLVVRFFV